MKTMAGLVLILIATGCSTIHPRNASQQWMDLFTPEQQTADELENQPAYGMDRVNTDYLRLTALIGAGYDFKFDFMSDTYQCCTELVYRTLNGKGTIEFPLVKMQGRWVLDANGIARYSGQENPNAFELILLADTAPKAEDYRALIYTGAEGKQKLDVLLKNP